MPLLTPVATTDYDARLAVPAFGVLAGAAALGGWALRSGGAGSPATEGEDGAVRTVLHVLPHPGGGGETYVDALAAMEGYRFERLFLAPSPRPAKALRALPRTTLGVFRAADVLHVHGEVAAGICLPVLAARRSVVTLHGLHLFVGRAA